MNIYQDIFYIIQEYIFGGQALTAHQDLVAVTLATIGCVFTFSIPFMVVWKVIKMICGR